MRNENVIYAICWTIGVVAVVACVTLGGLKGCEYSHLEEMACIEKGMIRIQGGGCVASKQEK